MSPDAAAGRGRDELFRELVVPEIPVLLRVATSRTRQLADAEDLVQDTLIRAYRGLHRFDGRHPRAWLLTILRNTEINRNQRRRPELLDDPDAGMGDLAAPSYQGSAESVALSDRFDAAVEEALRALPERQRDVVVLVDIEGLTYAEAAGALGVPEGTVMSRLHRARAQIRKRLGGSGVAPKRGDR